MNSSRGGLNMKIKQETVAFIHSVKAKLLLMGGVAIASVGILSIILVNMLGLVNKDAQLISHKK